MNSLKTVDKLQLGHLSQCEHYPGTSQKTGCNWSHCSFIDYFLWLLSVSGRKEGKENKFNILLLCKSSGCAGLYWLHSLQTGRILVLSVWLLWTEGPQQWWLLPFSSLRQEKCFIKAREGDCCFKVQVWHMPEVSPVCHLAWTRHQFIPSQHHSAYTGQNHKRVQVSRNSHFLLTCLHTEGHSCG